MIDRNGRDGATLSACPAIVTPVPQLELTA